MIVRHRRSPELPQALATQLRVPESELPQVPESELPQVPGPVLVLVLGLERALVPLRERARLAPVLALQRRHQ